MGRQWYAIARAARTGNRLMMSLMMMTMKISILIPKKLTMIIGVKVTAIAELQG